MENMQYCAGLPLVGSRNLEERERESLLRESKHKTLLALLFAASWPLFCLWLFSLGLIFDKIGLRFVSETILAALAIFSLFLMLPTAILMVRDMLRQRKMIKDTVGKNCVRRFEGALNPDDWTDAMRHKLVRRGLLNTENGSRNQIELLDPHDVIFTINGVRPKRWIKVELTTGAVADPSTPYFAVPAAWQLRDEKVGFERRRLSPEEIDEILSYARMPRIRILYLAWVFVMFGLVGRVTRWVASDVFRLSAQTTKWLAILIPCVILCMLLYRRMRAARALTCDAENGWAILCAPRSGENLGRKKGEPAVPVEVLPISSVVWMINGKPAAWRHKPTK